MSINFREQMASLKYTSLTQFFREADEQKKNKVETCPTTYEQLQS